MAGERTLVINIIGDSASAQRAFGKTATAAEAAAAGVGKAGKSIESTGAKLEKTGKKISAVGTGLTKYVSLPLVGIGAAAVKMGLDFQKSMLLVETHTESSRKEVDRYRKAILDMSSSGKYTQGPKEFGDAMYHIASDGYKGTKALKALRESANLAMLGQSDLAETTYAVVSAMKTGIKGTENLHQTIGVLNGTMGAGDTKMGELVAALSTGVVPSARAAGLELTDLGAALAFLTARGIPAQKAAYQLSMNFQQIVPYTKKARDAFKGLGLGQEELGKKAESGTMGWLKALEDLKAHLKGLDTHQQTMMIEEIFGGGRSSRGVIAQMQNLEDLRATYERLGVIAGRTDKNLAIARKSEANQWKEEWAQLQAALVELGNTLTPVLLPILKEVAHDVGDIAEAFESLPKPAQEWGVKLAIAGALLGPMIRGLGGIYTLVSKVTKAFEGMAAAEAATGVAGAEGAAAGAATRAGTGAAAGAAGARWLGTDAAPAAAARAGAYGEGTALAESGLFGLGAGAASKLSRGATVLGGVVGGYFAAEFGIKAIEGITGKDFLENQDLKTSLTHGFNTSHVAATEKMALAEASAKEQGIHPGLGPHTRELKGLEKALRDTMVRLGADASGGMSAITGDLKVGLEQTSQIFSTGTKSWRTHTAKAMEEAVASIRTGMRDGTISAEQGQREITRLLGRIHLIKGDDPFGLARATAKSFKEVGGVTEAGTNTWAKQLAQMPVAARKSSIDSTNQMLKAWAQGHPKIEHQIESLTNYEVTHFGATNKQLREGVQKGATGPIADAYRELANGVGGALDNIGTNTSSMLSALGLKNLVQFQALVLGPSTMPSRRGAAAAEAHHHPRTSYGPSGTRPHKEAATGYLPGSGLRDTIPIMAAPGEAILNRHQQGPVNAALQATYGIGLDQLFQRIRTPHYMAQGGQVQVSGPGVLGQLGHGALSKVVDAANAFIDKHRPKPASATSSAVGGGVMSAGEFLSTARRALAMTGHRGVRGGAQTLLWLATQESGLNPNSINNWDSNAAAGHPSQGLMELIPATFSSYHEPGTSSNIKDPLANIAASINYQFDKYGHLVHFSPYAAGGIAGKSAGGATASASSTGTADAAHVLGWAEHHLGNGDKWGYPGEWCGAFLGADMLAHGIQPPSGYPLASAWGSWGSPGDASPGNVVVIGGSGHVGLSLGGGKMISGNFSNSVAISTIAEAAGGRPITGYRKPPYAGGAPGGPTKEQREQRREHRKEQEKALHVSGHVAAEVPPLRPAALLPSAKALPKQIRALLHSPGLNYAGKVGISEMALGEAEGTEGTEDDRAVLDFQEELFKRRKKGLQNKLKSVNQRLKTANSPAQRNKLKAEQEHILSELGGIDSSLAGVRSTRKGLSEVAEAEEDPAVKAAEEAKQAAEDQKQAAEELKASIDVLTKEVAAQNAIATSEIGVNLAQAKRAMADMIANQLGPIVARGSLAVSIGTVGSS